ncbi:FAD binding domain-containing protein [Gammaproteobacteria bacterium]|nr:FAD binding domain-containing protein [Gammaproteobacteria bacterium]
MTGFRTTVNGVSVDVGNTGATTSLLDLLRETLNLKGTKQGCGSGDCGACTVMIAAADGQAEFRTVNACITPAWAARDKHVVTVEGVADGDDLHPVQQALIDQHASQCGFCTPGFVMSLVAYSLRADAPKRGAREELVSAISGNLCRCTGYGPIIAAGLQSYDAAGQLDHLSYAAQQPSSIETPSKQADIGYRIARSEAELGRWLQQDSASGIISSQSEPRTAVKLIAGATDAWVSVNQEAQEHANIIDISRIESLRVISQEQQALNIGACVSHEALLEFFTTPPNHSAAVEELLRRFGSPQIRHAGTIGGNLCGGSPIADWSPLLLALDARASLKSATAARILPLSEFFLGYRQTSLAGGEYLASVQLDIPSSWSNLSFEKISKRYEDDISSVCAAIFLDVADRTVRQARIAFGGVAATPARVREVEDMLLGKSLSDVDDVLLTDCLASVITPISDVRASADYRMQMAKTLLLQRVQDARKAN